MWVLFPNKTISCMRKHLSGSSFSIFIQVQNDQVYKNILNTKSDVPEAATTTVVGNNAIDATVKIMLLFYRI